MTPQSHVYAIVLAAGRSSRFGSPKLLADLHGRPILQHVLDAVARVRLAGIVAVLGEDAGALERVIDWHGARRVRNPNPASGISSSLRIGVDALPDDASGALIVLGDQPLTSPTVVRTLLETPLGGAVAAVPVYERSGRGHPVLLARRAFDLTARARGDRGLRPLLDSMGDGVVEVPVPGENADVDTPADLARLTPRDPLRPDPAVLEAAWAARVEAERQQVDRVRELPPRDDFYAPITSVFVADPRREGDAVLDILLALARPGETWLDVGAGAGRYALPIALRVGEVIAVEPSPAMRDALLSGARDHDIRNVRALPDPWPMPSPPRADIALVAHLGYDVVAIGPFLDALEAAAARLCVAVLMDRWPVSTFGSLWEAAHGEPRHELPALREVLALLLARGRLFDVRLAEREPRVFASRDALLEVARHQIFVRPGSDADARLRAAIERVPAESDGSIALRSGPRWIGVASWAPPDSRPGGGAR